MPAVYAMPAELALERAQHVAIVALLFAGGKIFHGLPDFLAALATEHHRRDRGAGQRVMDALGDRHRLGERRVLAGNQLARAKRLHHRDPHAPLFAQPVQLRAHGIQAMEGRYIQLIRLGQPLQSVDPCGMQIKGQIDAEHHQFRHARFDHLARYHGIVRTKTNVPDVAQLLALEHVADKIRLKHAAIVLFGIDEKDHAEINIPE